jgi:glycosidase
LKNHELTSSGKSFSFPKAIHGSFFYLHKPLCMSIKKLFFLGLLSLILVSACKEDPPPPIDNTPSRPVYSQYGTPFDNIPTDKADLVMYEVNLRAFSNNGDLQGVIDRLDELKALGVNVIWLMPIHPIGELNSVNSPYSVKDYKAVSSEYGNLDDLRQLTDAAHQRDMAVIMDWVANHTAWDNPWIQNRSWYTQDASGNIIHPAGTNWLDVADLNFDNRVMQDSMIDAMKYWILEANVDGYRCDVADGVPFDFWQRAFDSLEALPNRDYVLLAEGLRADHFQAGFHLTYAWDYYGRMKSVFNGGNAASLFNIHQQEYSGIPTGGHKLRFTTNHDESAWDNTPMVLFDGKEGALAASVATIFMGGVPLLYTGQEVGRQSRVPFFSNSPIDWSTNPDMLQAYQDLMAVYSQSEAARQGNLEDFSTVHVVCFKKAAAGQELLVMVNMREQAQTFSLPAALQNSSWTDAFSQNVQSLGSDVSLDGYQYIILER